MDYNEQYGAMDDALTDIRSAIENLRGVPGQEITSSFLQSLADTLKGEMEDVAEKAREQEAKERNSMTREYWRMVLV